MKLLLDQNISYKLVEDLEHLFPESNHVRLLDLADASDEKVWAYAKEQSYILVTQDSDFNDRSVIYGHPPKIIWIKAGNVATSYIRNMLIKNVGLIESFEKDRELACLELY